MMMMKIMLMISPADSITRLRLRQVAVEARVASRKAGTNILSEKLIKCLEVCVKSKHLNGGSENPPNAQYAIFNDESTLDSSCTCVPFEEEGC